MGTADGPSIHQEEPAGPSHELTRVESRALAAEAAERRRIGQALHDGAQQRLVVLAIGLAMLIDLIESDPTRAVGHARKLEKEAQDAIGELRALVDGLQPPVLTDFGLIHALHSVARSFPVPVSLITQGIDRYDSAVEDAVFFTCREALQNSIKHAPSATSIVVMLIDHQVSLEFSVEDNGVGFDAALPGSGYATMHHRIESLGGGLTIRSAPGAGTRVHGAIPLR